MISVDLMWSLHVKITFLTSGRLSKDGVDFCVLVEGESLLEPWRRANIVFARVPLVRSLVSEVRQIAWDFSLFISFLI